MLRSLVCFALTTFSTASLLAANPAADLDSRRKALNALLDEQWEYTMRHNPIYASTLGDRRYNDQIDDFSQEAIDADLEYERRFIPRLEAIDTTGFPDQEVLNKRLMIRDMRMDLDRARFKLWEMPVDQQSGSRDPNVRLVAQALFSCASCESVGERQAGILTTPSSRAPSPYATRY